MEADEVLSGIRAHVDAGRVPGAVVGVRHRGRTGVVAAGAVAPGGDPVRPDAVVRISSNTKPLMAALALRMVRDGAFALDDPVERFLPELTARRVLRALDGPVADTVPAERAITVEDLLTMRMGFGFVWEAACPAVERATALGLGFGPPDPTGPPAPDEWLARFATLPLLEQPGAVWRYEMSFAVLGVLLARAAGQPLADALGRRLLEPLGMADTGFVADPARLVPAFAREGGVGGEGGDGDLVPFDGVADSRWLGPPAFPDARGGLVSTAADLLAFAGML